MNNKQCQNDRLNETLNQLRYQHEMLLKWVNVAVIVVNREGVITDVNQQALNILGWEKDELVGMNCHSTLHHTMDDGGEYPWEFCPVFAALEDGSSHHVDGDAFWKKDGSSFSADFIVCAVRDETHSITGAILTFRNITEQRLKEAKRVHNLKLLSIGELAAGIAHEINTPVQFIGSNLSFLEESFGDLLRLLETYELLRMQVQKSEQFPDTVKEIEELNDEVDVDYLKEELPLAFEQTLQGVERVRKLVQAFKRFSHSNEEDKRHADLNEIITNALIVCKNEYKYCAEVKLNLTKLPEIEVSPGDIGQVFLNLVVNAAHAIEEKNRGTEQLGTITISSSYDDNAIIIMIEDTGNGIDEKIHERIFDPFFTTKDVGRGSGQGLAIAKNIVEEKHGGELSFSSIQGKGTTFSVLLPRNPS